LQIAAEQRERRSDERERRRERAAMAESQQVQALRAEIAELRGALAAKANHDDLSELLNAVREITTERVPDWIKAAIAKSDAALRGLIAEKFGELIGRIAAIDPAQVQTARREPFKFAGEKTGENGDAVELPNPLPPRRAIN
jgi:hypothetical protein